MEARIFGWSWVEGAGRTEGKIGMASAPRGGRRLTYVITPAPERNALLGPRLGTSVRPSMTRMSMPSSFYTVIDFNFVQYLSLHDFELASVLILASHKPQAISTRMRTLPLHLANNATIHNSFYPTHSHPNATCRRVNPCTFPLTSLSACPRLPAPTCNWFHHNPDSPRVAALSPYS